MFAIQSKHVIPIQDENDPLTTETLRRISPGRLWGVQQITGAGEQRSGAPPRLHQAPKDDHR